MEEPDQGQADPDQDDQVPVVIDGEFNFGHLSGRGSSLLPAAVVVPAVAAAVGPPPLPPGPPPPPPGPPPLAEVEPDDVAGARPEGTALQEPVAEDAAGQPQESAAGAAAVEAGPAATEAGPALPESAAGQDATWEEAGMVTPSQSFEEIVAGIPRAEPPEELARLLERARLSTEGDGACADPAASDSPPSAKLRRPHRPPGPPPPSEEFESEPAAEAAAVAAVRKAVALPVFMPAYRGGTATAVAHAQATDAATAQDSASRRQGGGGGVDAEEEADENRGLWSASDTDSDDGGDNNGRGWAARPTWQQEQHPSSQQDQGAAAKVKDSSTSTKGSLSGSKTSAFVPRSLRRPAPAALRPSSCSTQQRRRWRRAASLSCCTAVLSWSAPRPAPHTHAHGLILRPFPPTTLRLTMLLRSPSLRRQPS